MQVREAIMNRSGDGPGIAATSGKRFQGGVLVGLLLALAALLAMCMALPAAAGPLEDWRASAAELRKLAEYDVPLTHARVLQLQKTMPPDATAADRARLLNLQARTLIYLGSSAEATRIAQQAYELALGAGDRIGQAEADLNITLSSVNEGKINLLQVSAPRALAVLQGVDRPDLLCEAMLRMAMMYHRLGQLEDSVSMTMKTMEIARASKLPLPMTYAHQGLAMGMGLSERFKEANEHTLKMRAQANAAGSRMLEGYAMIGIGSAQSKQGNVEEGEKTLREAIALFRAAGAPFGVSHAQFTLADVYRYQDRHAEALPLLGEVIANYEKFGNIIGLWYALNTRSESHLKLHNQAAALADAERAHGYARQINLPASKSESAQRVAAIYAAMGEHRKAYELSAEGAAEMANATRKKGNERMLQVAQQYETESKRKEITELTRRNELQLAELRQRELQQRWLWTVLGASIVVLGVTAVFLVRLRRSHATIRTLNASLEQRVQVRTSELRQQTRYLRTLIDTLPWWVWLKDTHSRYLAVNQAAADTCGLSADELVGKSDLEVRPREMADAFRRDDQAVMATRCRKTVEELQLLTNGESTWMETFKAPVLDEDGSVLGTVGFARDISERKAAEAAREAALAEAQRLARVRSDFLAQMSHELRTPLNGVLGYAQILRRDKSLGERQRAGVTVIQQSGEHLLTLINDILDLAKIEAGKLELSCSTVSLKPCLQSIGEIIRIKAEQKQLDFVCKIDPSMPSMVHADEKRLRQVLLNLLANAVKFTERGFVELRVRYAAPDRFRFEVTDSGIGIAPGGKEAIFEPFEQADHVQRRFGGTGLGLAITRQFVHLMGGDIRVDSEVGKGSTFWFELSLPLVQGDARPHEAEQVVTGYAGPRKTILVVDDVAGNRSVAVDLLGQLGFAMLEAVDGLDAIRQTELLKPDLVLMDIVMPGMDGLEATRRLRAIPACSAVPIIAISASAFSQDEERYMASDVNAFLPKPVDHGRLLVCIAKLLQLQLVYEAPAGPEGEPGEAPAIVAPPKAQIDVLFGLARLGNMQDILRWAGELELLDGRYRPFSERLRVLANGYQSRAILNFVSAYVGTSEMQSNDDSRR
jgi:PAS domain S-box-containing protein